MRLRGKNRFLILPILLALGACSINPADGVSSGSGLAVSPSCASQLAGPYALIEATITTDTGREIPVTVLHPENSGTYPLIAFSHGAFAAPDRYLKMLGPLAAAGHVVVAPMHIDSEEFGRAEPAGPDEVWRTRNEDMRLALGELTAIEGSLAQNGIALDRTKVIAMGHSYGALMAQLAGGARAIEGDGSTPDRRDPAVDAVVVWSPPGVLPGRMTPESWSTLATPSFTITGTADVLPGFIDNWEDHKASFEYAPVGTAELWVGQGVDHYFGGMFGREKPADEASNELFQLALERTLAFMQRKTAARAVCLPQKLSDGEVYETR